MGPGTDKEKRMVLGMGTLDTIQIPDYKTVYIEQVGQSGRSIMLTEYQVDGKTYWAGYSPSSETIFVSKAGRD